jgi:micrococcal nuclease
MHRFSASCLVTALIAIAPFSVQTSEAAPEVKTYRGTITKVSDGDTVRFMPDHAKKGEEAWSIRMTTIDTAELHLPGPGGVYSQGYWAEEGKAELESIVRVGDRVELDSFGIDNYGRVLGKVFKGDLDVNLEMVRSGWAALYVICDGKAPCDLDPEYRRACREAVKDERGLFDSRNPVPELPFLFRSRKQERPLSKFVGSMKTKKYYPPEEYGRVSTCERVFFMTESAARKEGFEPAF